jgi:hypothetical protein
MTDAAREDAMLPRTFVIAASMTLVFILSASAQEKLSARMERLVQPGVQDPGCDRTKHAAAGMASKSVQRWSIQGSQSGGHLHGLACVVLDSDGRPTNTFRHVGLTVPAKQKTKEETVAMVVTGLSAPPGYAPGPYGNFGAAKSRVMRTLRG